MRPDDNELVKRAQKGDSQAFEELVKRYDRRVLGIAMNYVNDMDEAKDIFQEVFMRVHRALDRFRLQAKFSTWVYRITTNVCLTHTARKRSRPHLSIDEELAATGERSTWLEAELATPAESERYAYSGELGESIREAMKALSPQQRLVFALRHYEGYKLREIAEILECAEGTVKKHLFTATHRMRTQLSGFLAQEASHGS